jgi:membrane-bound inhibitor of C-type lysozyme
MIFEHQSKNKKILLVTSLAVLIVGFLVFMYSPVIFQEGNPWPEIKGIAQLKFGSKDIVQLSDSDNKFMTESKNGTVIHDFMKTKGYEFTEQMGSGYFFKSATGQNAIATHKYYSRYYSLWTITENDNNLWTTTTNDNGVTFQYPKELLAKYVSVVEWPSVIKIETGTYSCKTTPLEVSSMSDITSQRLVDDRTYCVNVKHEGAAGSVYSSYIYTTAQSDKLITVNFTLRYPNCNNYDEEQNRVCTSERKAFDIDATVDRIVQTIKQITDYDSCVAAGFPIMKSNPPQCATPDGQTFVENK